MRTTRTLFPHLLLRFVGDAGLDNPLTFQQVDRLQSQFIFRASHTNRWVDVYEVRGFANPQLQRWEPQEHLAELGG